MRNRRKLIAKRWWRRGYKYTEWVCKVALHDHAPEWNARFTQRCTTSHPIMYNGYVPSHGDMRQRSEVWKEEGRV